MVNFTITTGAAAWLFAVVVLALTDATLNAVLAIFHLIEGIKARKKAKPIGYVKITGDTYADGNPIPKWVKSGLWIVARIEGDKALACSPLNWVKVNDLTAANKPGEEKHGNN